jgi:hypothetical protein
MKTVLLLFSAVVNSFLFGQNPSVSIVIVQQDKRIEITENDTLILLKPAAFHFEIELEKCQGVFVQASRTSDYYDTPKDSLLRDWTIIPDKVMAEDDFNTNKDLIVDPEGFSYWFYDPKKDWHRFDKNVIAKKKHIKAKYTVEKLFDPTIPTTDELTEYIDTLYLLFFIAEENDSHQLTNELSRKIIRIRFQ